MDRLVEILAQVLTDVRTTVQHNWPFLLASIVVASLVQVYVGSDRLAGWLRRRVWVAVLGAVALGALTPFCSCGTTAVVLGALASSVPWAPVVAFMVSSPLTSPSEYVLSNGLFGARFALTFFLAAIVVGLLSGVAAWALERAGLLAGQARMRTPSCSEPGCSSPPGGSAVPAVQPEGRTLLAVLERPVAVTVVRDRRRELAAALWTNTRRLVTFFLAFATLGYLVIELIPTRVLTDYLGAGSLAAVPLAATLGVPVYVNSDASLPLIASLMAGGMAPGPALAFLMTGAGTSIGAVSGMLVIARWRVVALAVASLWVGAVLLGYLAPLWL